MKPNQIKHMVNRFLGWKLPENFSPDAGISFKAAYNEGTAHPMKHEPSGTNLFDATQTEAMVRYMAEGMPEDSGSPTPQQDATEFCAQQLYESHQDCHAGIGWELRREEFKESYRQNARVVIDALARLSHPIPESDGC